MIIRLSFKASIVGLFLVSKWKTPGASFFVDAFSLKPFSELFVGNRAAAIGALSP